MNIKFIQTVCDKFKLKPDNEAVAKMASMDRLISSWGAAGSVSLGDMYKACTADSETMGAWLVYTIFGEELRDIIKSVSNVDMLATSADDAKITTDYARAFLTDRNLIAKTKAIAEGKMDEAVEKIKRMIWRRYITRRNKKTSNGELDMTLTTHEIKRCDEFLGNILNNIPEYRRVHRNNSNVYYVKGPFDDYAINFKYRREKYKEVICNECRVTPDSFDMWYDAISRENEEFLTHVQTTDNIRETVMETTDQDRMVGLIKKYGHLLKKVPDTHKGLVYVSDFVKTVDQVEAHNIESSLKRYKNNPEALKIWQDHLKNIDATHKHAVDRSLGISKTYSVSKDQIKRSVIVRDVTNSITERKKKALKHTDRPAISYTPKVEVKKDEDILDFI